MSYPGAPPQQARGLVARVRSHLIWRWGVVRKLPARLINDWFGNVWYDRWLKRKISVTSGQVSAAPRCAIFVIYPRLGLQLSHLNSLAYLLRKGFSPVVVSNLPLSPDERTQLTPLCWRLVERPNYGYDFGAYRDGVLMLLNELSTVSQLLLVNDSVWFPVPASVDWLSRAEQTPADLVGAVSNDGLVDYLSDPGRGAPWRYNPSAPRLHYCSFALLVGSRILNDVGFRRFWQELKLTSDKFLTIRRGEVGFSRWVIERGYSHTAALEMSRFDQVVEQMGVAQLRELAEHLIIPEDAELRAEQRKLLEVPDGQSNPSDLRRFILWATAATGPAYALPYWFLQQRSVGFLKKSPMWLSDATAQITESLVERFGDPAMLEEARQLRVRR